MVQKIFHLVLALNATRDVEVHTERLVGRDDDIFFHQSLDSPQLVFAVVDVH